MLTILSYRQRLHTLLDLPPTANLSAGRAPDSDYYSCTTIPEDPPSTFASCPSAESYLLRNAVADFSTADPLVRRYRETRALPRVFADSRHYTSRHVTSSQPWPPRRDSLNAPIPGVRQTPTIDGLGRLVIVPVAVVGGYMYDKGKRRKLDRS